jgi:hypothetical protein
LLVSGAGINFHLNLADTKYRRNVLGLQNLGLPSKNNNRTPVLKHFEFKTDIAKEQSEKKMSHNFIDKGSLCLLYK